MRSLSLCPCPVVAFGCITETVPQNLHVPKNRQRHVDVSPTKRGRLLLQMTKDEITACEYVATVASKLPWFLSDLSFGTTPSLTQLRAFRLHTRSYYRRCLDTACLGPDRRADMYQTLNVSLHNLCTSPAGYCKVKHDRIYQLAHEQLSCGNKGIDMDRWTWTI